MQESYLDLTNVDRADSKQTTIKREKSSSDQERLRKKNKGNIKRLRSLGKLRKTLNILAQIPRLCCKNRNGKDAAGR